MLRRIFAASAASFLTCSAAFAQSAGGSVAVPGVVVTVPNVGYDDERAAFKAGREYVFTTGNNGVATNPGLSVPANSYLNTRICNTSATKPYYIAALGRFFDTSSTVITEYFGVANTDLLTTTQAATLTGCGAVSPNTCNLTYGTNLLPSAAAQTDVAMSFGVGTAMPTVSGAAGVPSGNGLIYPGTKNEISKPRVLPPGKCFSQVAVGQSNATNGLGGTAAAYFVFRAYIYSDQ